jgi:hypothetical protein
LFLGLHCPTSGATDRFHATAQALRSEAFLYLPAENAGDAQRYPGTLPIVRLSNWRIDEDPQGYVNRVASRVEQWRATPDVVFQLGNECDIEMGHTGDNFPLYARAMHSRWPGIRVANPPLTAENTHLWTAETLAGADMIACHCYFQITAEDISNPNLGAAYRHLLPFGQPVIVTEINCVNASGNPTDTNIDWDERNRQVGEWAVQAHQDGVHACCLFIADASPDWAAFNVTPEDAASIRAQFDAAISAGNGSPPDAVEEVIPVSEVYGEDLLAMFETQIGHPKSGDYDMRNGFNHPWAYFCEAGVESTGRNCTLPVVPRSSAITAGEWAREAGVLQGGEPEHGGVIYLGDAFFRDYGHTGFWNADRQQMLSTLTDGTGVGYKHWGPNTVGYQGWYRLPGIAGARRASEPPMPSWIVQANNPFQQPGQREIGVGGGFARLYSSVDIGADPMVTFGFALANEETAVVDGQTRTIQRFERATMLWQPEYDFPSDVVVALLSSTITTP